MKKASTTRLLMIAAGAVALSCTGTLQFEADPRETDGSAGARTDTNVDPTAGSSGTLDPAAACETPTVGRRVLRRLTRQEYKNTLRDSFSGIATPETTLSPDAVSELGFDNDSSVLVVGKQTAKELLNTAEALANTLTDDAHFGAPSACAPNVPGSACALDIIGRYGRRLFRRPLSEEEQARYLGLYDSIAAESDFKTGLKWALVALFESPYVVYRHELGTPSSDGSYQLTNSELATELSYTYAGTLPSDALLAKAERGELAAPEVRLSEARALLSSLDGREMLQRFLTLWLRYGAVRAEQKTNVADFSGVRDAMVQETRAFLEEVLIVDQGGVVELLTAPYTVTDPLLGTFYGFEPASAAGYSRVQRPAGHGIGLLAQASLLAHYAHSDGSSPTRRGLLVFEKLLCFHKPNPPASGVPNIPPPAATLTTRQRYEQAHAAQDACKSCHNSFDPIGFGFEHFDEVGRFRVEENGQPIDDSGHALDATQNILFTFDGQEELAQKLALEPRVSRCVSGLLSAYAFGSSSLSCASAEAAHALAEARFGIVDYLVALAAAPHFARRTP